MNETRAGIGLIARTLYELEVRTFAELEGITSIVWEKMIQF